MTKQTLSFQAEVAQLLHLVTHSLYSNKEIFLRELISNASDACDKLRFEAINDGGLYENDSELKVRVTFDKDAKTLTITDNGIGMSAQEAIDNLGTIERYKGFRQQIERRPKGRLPTHRPIWRGLLLGLHRGRQDQRGITPRWHEDLRRRALGQRRFG